MSYADAWAAWPPFICLLLSWVLLYTVYWLPDRAAAKKQGEIDRISLELEPEIIQALKRSLEDLDIDVSKQERIRFPKRHFFAFDSYKKSFLTEEGKEYSSPVYTQICPDFY